MTCMSLRVSYVKDHQTTRSYRGLSKSRVAFQVLFCKVFVFFSEDFDCVADWSNRNLSVAWHIGSLSPSADGAGGRWRVEPTGCCTPSHARRWGRCMEKWFAVEKTQRKARDIGLCDGSAKGDFFPVAVQTIMKEWKAFRWGLSIIFSFSMRSNQTYPLRHASWFIQGKCNFFKKKILPPIENISSF